MNNPIKEVVRFNEQAGLLDKGYDDFLESSFQIEEALEGFSDHQSLCNLLARECSIKDDSPKELSRNIVALVMNREDLPELSDVDRLDKACDAVVFAVGSMAKLGLNAQQITKALNTVMRCNFQKLGAPKDEFGKQMKPEGWTGPEPELQKILDER